MIDLVAERGRLLAFAEGSRHPDGGFAWLRDDGSPDLERPRELWITTRMTYVFALAGRDDLAAHGLDALRGGVRKTHMVDGRLRHSLLLEIYTDCGVGTEIVLNELTTEAQRHREGHRGEQRGGQK